MSITAKDRELTSTGIQALEPSLTSFEALLNNVLDVLNFPEYKAKDVKEKEASVRGLIADSGGLLFVDNLETVDDARIIQFLDSLPFGFRALTTSRRIGARKDRRVLRWLATRDPVDTVSMQFCGRGSCPCRQDHKLESAR